MRWFWLAAIASSGALLAQPMRPPSMATQPWWESKVVVSSLNLTEAQTKQLNDIQAAHINRLMALREAVMKAERNLDEIYNESGVDEIKADAAVDQYANARDNLTRELTKLSLQLRSVLTDEQWHELVARQNGRGGRGLGPGRGRRGSQPVGS